MERTWALIAMGCCALGLLFCVGVATLTDNSAFMLAAFVMLIGYAAAGIFNRCPHCGHNLMRHHLFISFCPYCGGCL